MRRALHAQLILSGIVNGILVALLATTPAWAHDAVPFYPALWSAEARGAVAIYNEPNVSGEFLSRVLDGARAWDDLGTSLDFRRVGTASLSRNPCDVSSRGKNLVYKGRIDGRGNHLATTWVCRSPERMGRFVMQFDSSEDWYTGTSLIVPKTRPDLASVATHEFGHAGGWSNHYDDTGIGLGGLICSNTSGQATMCATYHAGTARQRSLHPHDVHTIITAY